MRRPESSNAEMGLLSMPFGFGQGKTSTNMAVFDGPACRAVEGVSVVLPAGKDGASVGVEHVDARAAKGYKLGGLPEHAWVDDEDADEKRANNIQGMDKRMQSRGGLTYHQTVRIATIHRDGTDGYYASKKAAADVRDEWIKKGRPESWMAKVGF